MPQIIADRRRVAKIIAIGIGLKLAITAAAYALFIDMHELATAAL